MKIESSKEALSRISQDRHGMRAFAQNPHIDFKDKVVIVLGNSPAISKVDLSLLNSFLSIGVNRIGRVYSPTVLLFTDDIILSAEEEFFKSFNGPILTWQNFEKRWVQSAPNVRFFMLAPAGAPEQWIWPKTMNDPLIREGSTTAYAIQLAVLGGAKAVGVLGVDFSAHVSRMRGNNQTHFYGDGASIRSSGGGDWSLHAPFYSSVHKWAAAFNTEIINLSPFPDTPINRAGWPKMTLDEFSVKYGQPAA